MKKILLSAIAIQILVTTSVAQLAISGPTELCQGNTVTLTVGNGFNQPCMFYSVAYYWYKNNVAVTFSSSTTYSADQGVYKVQRIYKCTSGDPDVVDYSPNFTVTTINPPIATITANGDSTFCPGGSVVLNASTGTGLTYQWTKNSINISGAIAASYTANVSGSYAVVVSNACSVASTSSATTVTVDPNLSPPAVITALGATSFCGSVVLNVNTGTGFTYQWSKNGYNIPSGTSASWTATTSGSYSAVVTNGAGCSATSSDNTIIVYPLPNVTLGVITSPLCVYNPRQVPE
ncbi:MAG: hypothetical protein K8R85_04610 [Bacteroidetes bacterium]|nr:hypothetical protein [Bacteroidota bacterium]